MKDINIKKFKPLFNTIITTLDAYEEDLVLDGVIVAPAGTIKLYQKVIGVGNMVRDIKEGDLVLINFENFKVRQYKEGDIKGEVATMENVPEYRFPKVIIDGNIYSKLTDRDIEGVIEEYEEVELKQPEISSLL